MGKKGVFKHFSVVEKKVIEVERIYNGAGGGRISISERGPKGVFQVSTTEGGGRWLGKFLCELSLTPMDWKKYTDNLVSIVGISKENRQGRYLEVMVTHRQGGNRVKVLRLPAGKGRNGWADVGLCLLDLFEPGVKADKENVMGEDSRQFQRNIYPMVKTNSVMQRERQPMKLRSNQKEEEIPRGETTQKEQMVVAIGGVFNRNTITQYSWWESSVFCRSISTIKNWDGLKKKVEVIVGEVTIKRLGDNEVMIDTQSREMAWKLESMQSVEEGGVRFNMRRWSPECGSLNKGMILEKERWVLLQGIPYHLRFEEAVNKMMKVFCQNFEVEKVSTIWWRRDEIRVKTKGVRLQDIPRVLFVEDRGFKFPIIVALEEETGGQKEEWQSFSKSGEEGGDRCTRCEPVEASGRGDFVPMGQEASLKERSVQVAIPRVDHVMTQKGKQEAVGLDWTVVSGNSKPSVAPETKSWAEIVKSNRFEGLEVEKVTETQETVLEQVQEIPEPSHRNRPKPNGSKTGMVQSFNSGPSLKLSRLLWPKHRSGVKERLSRIKRMARQAVEKENMRGKNLSREQQVFDCPTIISDSDSDDSINSPMGKVTEARGKGKEILSAEGINEQNRAKRWVKKELVAGDNKEGSKNETLLGEEEVKAQSVGVNFAHLIDLECNQLCSETEVDDWVSTIVVPITKQLELSAAKGEMAISRFFKELGYAKLKEKRGKAHEDDDRERLLYENCNEDFREKEVS
ncbi:hypothetical protein FRX31_032122 [Thalictrum thalictroides]|uniref:DUF4283 domain-containing protein n=1 Tax=Thalictrum thalictroides TaxID=46969 RepID=A0A7J6V0L9_THATH|nr:hypothetical protein FRX31_032122 [Thalictrum thalictroides]